MEKSTPHIRWMIYRDMPALLAIEAEAFEEPWAEEDFVRVLRKRRHIGIVAELDNAVVAYMIYELHKVRITLLNFAVAAAVRRQGIGRLMVDRLKTKLSVQRRRDIVEHVSDDNLRAQLFWKAMGFIAVKVERNALGPGRDTYLMRFRVEDAENSRAAFVPANRISRALGEAR